MTRTLGLLLVLGLSAVARAQSPSDTHRLYQRLERVHERLRNGGDPSAVTGELDAIRSVYERRVRRLEAELGRAERALSDLALGGVAAERLQIARDAFEVSHVALLAELTRLAEAPNLSELEACLRTLAPLARAEREDLLSAQEQRLPLREIGLTPPPLVKSGGLSTASFSAETADVAAIGSVPDAIRELATTVDGPVEAYELVKNQTRFELYFGSMKGSVQTLLESSGNDADINRLLVDLLRAKGVPARYVRGVVRLTMDQAMGLIGAELPARVEQALSAALVPYEAQFVAGGVGAVEMEHIWVEAYVPWANYRGAGVDTRGRRWVPLDASFKFHVVDEGHPVLEEMGFDAEAFVRAAFEAAPQTDPMTALRAEVSSFLDANVPGVSFGDALRELEQRPEVYGILPASLPYEVVSVSGVSFEFPEQLEHQLRFVGTRPDGERILDTTFPVPRLIGGRLSLSYLPAEQEDRETAEAFGGLYQTPPFLVRVRPVLRSAGLVVYSGGPIDMGGRFVLEARFMAPAGTVGVDNEMFAGAYAALALSGRAPGYQEASDSAAGEILNQRALDYLARWNETDRELSGLTRVLTFRPVPSHVVVKNAVEVQYASSPSGASLVPLSFTWKGVQVDADLRPTAPVPVGSDGANRRAFFFLSGLAGSELEGRILEESLGINAISTVELFRLTDSRGITVREINRDNVDEVLAVVDLDAALEDAIAVHAHLGRIVRAPQSELSFLAWSGAGFTAWDPVTGESAYMLSGRIAGGTSTDDPGDWPEREANSLRDPSEPVSEPSRIVGAIRKVPSSDLQEALVGRALPLPLGVLVTDNEGNPVADGVPVLFTSLDSGGGLASEDGVQQDTRALLVPTRNGRARVRFVVGTSTRDNPWFIVESADDAFATQVGRYRVSVAAGGVAMEDPFVAHAFPDDQRDETGRHGRLKYVSGRQLQGFPLSTPDVPMWVEVVDQFSNPLSNMPVDWVVKDAERFAGSPEPLPPVFQNAKLRSVDFSAFLDADLRLTSHLGSRVFAHLGDVDATRYRIEASTDDDRYPIEPVAFLRDTYDLGSGRAKAPIGEKLVVSYVDKGVPLRNGTIVFEDGGRTLFAPALTMGPVSGNLPDTIEFQLRAYQEDFELVQDSNGKWLLEGRGRFSRRDVMDAEVIPLLLEGEGAFRPGSLDAVNAANGLGYEFGFTFGAQPGMRRYGFSVDADLKRPTVNRDSGEVSSTEFKSRRSDTVNGRMIFGVSARLLPQGPDPFVLNGSGHLAPGSTLGFSILPEVVDDALSRETFARVLELYENGKLTAVEGLPVSSPQMLDSALGYDPDNVYQTRVVLLAGTTMEVFSPLEQLRFFHAFMKDSRPRPVLVKEFPDPDRPGESLFVTSKDASLEYFIRPSQIVIRDATVELVEVDRKAGTSRLVRELDGSPFSGDGSSLLAKGFVANPVEKEYAAFLRLAPAGRPGLRSEPVPVLFSRVLHEVSDPVRVTLVTGATDVCFVPGRILYELDEDAEVTISIIEGGELDGHDISGGVERVVFQGIQARTAPGSPVVFVVGPNQLLNTSASHRFRIRATSVAEPELEDEYIGTIIVQRDGNVVLPVGRTYVKGVDLFDGHLVSASTDARISGRGPALELVRTYASSGDSDTGVLGAGWSMNYFSTLIIDNCGYMVVGGDGSGQRFTRIGETFIPQKGYHGRLEAQPDGSFDFTTKGGVVYRYADRELFEGDARFAGRPTLELIRDPNGNRIELVYDDERNIIQAKEVFEGGVEGRSLGFEYVQVRGEKRLSRVTGPLGLEIRYVYDEYANLVEVKRDERVEKYDYSVANLRDRHNLLVYTDPNGNITRYRYYEDGDVFPGETAVEPSRDKFEWVRAVDEPEGVTTSFIYDVTKLTDGELLTTVTDGRRNDTLYTLNLSGSPTRIEEPAGVVTTMTWAANDIFKESELDANGRLTLFEYDDRANLTKETIVTSDLGNIVTEFEYEPAFNKMTLKRVHNADAAGLPVVQETRFDIDPVNGNLERVTDAEGNVTEYDYFPNGDLQFVRGTRPGQKTELGYDPFGNPEQTIDSEANETLTVYDVRSRLRSSSDTFGRNMTQEYDALDRSVRIERTDSLGSSETEVVTRGYYPGGQLRFEVNGLGLRTDFTLDGLNRVIGTRDDLGNVTASKYDANSNLEGATDRRGVVTTSTYDVLNRLTRVETRGPFGPTQIVMEADYDAVGNKRFETDLSRSRTDFEYDGLYRVTRRILPTRDPSSGSRYDERFTYDNAGNRLSETDANGETTRFAYDRLNRLTFQVDAEQNEVRFEYDEAGNRTLEQDVTRGLTTTTSYDLLNRPLSRVVDGAGANPFHYETGFEYVDAAHEVLETDPRGFVRTSVLDAFDRVHEVRQPTGTEELATRNFYDANGNLKRTVDVELRETHFVYDGLNRLREIRDALGASTFMDYDGEGNKTEAVNRRGLPTRFAYDNLGRLARTEIDQPITQGGALTTSRIAYSDLTRERFEHDARGHRTTFVMDEAQRVVEIRDPEGGVARFEYDGVNKSAEVDKRGHRSEFLYDGLNRLVEVKDARDQRLVTEYRDSERRVVEHDKKSIEKTTQLDALGRLVSVMRDGVILEQHEYDGNNNRVVSTDANLNRTRFDYDGANRLTERHDAFGSPLATTTMFRYDRAGNLLEEKDGRDTGMAFDVRNTYDALNRLQTTTDAEGNSTRFEYDEEGNRTAVVEPKSLAHRTELDYGELNELIEVRMPDGGIYRYHYDPNRNRIRQEDGEGNVVTFTYDKLNRVELMTQDPDEGAGGFNYVTRHGYDANGNETLLVDPKGQVIDFQYDELNRIEKKVYHLTAGDFEVFTRTHEITYHYDPNDNLERTDELKSSGTDPPAIVSSFKTYDRLDRLKTETDAWGRILRYAYDDQGNRTLLIDPDNKRTGYEFDALNRLELMRLDADTPAETLVDYEYLPDGLKDTVTNPNGTATKYTYDAADRMKTITHSGSGGTVSAYAYDYDENGNRERQVETNAGRTETTEYTYDVANRLKSVTYEAGTANRTQVTYVYDKAGNRLTEQEIQLESQTATKDLTYAYDAINRLDTITDNLGAGNDVAYLYDSNGNTTQKTKNGATTTFYYDVRDQLGEVRQDGSVLGRYGYDSEGLRILKIGDDGMRQYTYDQLSVITEADQANVTVSKYDYGMDQLVRLDNRNEGRSFFHLDILRSTVSLTDAVGGSRQSIFYDAWGNERDRVGASANKFTFTGHEKDDETGLIYAKARFYDPDTGRFLNQDTLLGHGDKPPSLHRYAYSFNSPPNFVDLSGNIAFVPILIYAGLSAILTAEATVLLEEYEEGVNFEFGADTALRATKNAAAAAAIVGSGGIFGGGLTATVVGGVAAFDIGQQTLVEGRDLVQVDVERTLRVGGVAAPTAGFASLGLAAGGAIAAGTTGALAGFTLVGAADGGLNILEGYQEGNVGKAAFGLAEVGASTLGARALAKNFRSSNPRVVFEDSNTVEPRLQLPPGEPQTIPPPRQLGPGASPGQRQTRFVADPDANTKDLFTGRGNLNPQPKKGPFTVKENGTVMTKAGIAPLQRPGFVDFQGLEVRGVRDLSHIPVSTLRAMQVFGFAATDANGNRLVLHHLQQSTSGPVVEIPAPRHSVWNPRQHPLGNTPGAGLSAEQRDAFGRWRVEYWKARATDELNRRRLQ